MPKYTLHYFQMRGLGELCRQIFALAEVEFEDKRYDMEKEWPAFKSQTPFGQLPVLEVDGLFIPQLYAHCRMLAAEHGFAGNSPFESAWVDAIADQHKDFYWGDFKKFWWRALDAAEGDLVWEELTIKFGIPERDKFFPLIEKQLKETATGFLVGNSVSWVDLLISEHVSVIKRVVPGFLDAYPETKEHAVRIQSISQIKKWIERRPITAH
ncbi:hypothetical protein PFISCL1PPCAC_14727 [Pristionchus fissidentatus]|uniref:Glutathione S-transferase n=1 Tax=Pristionchus fissidentatus TaxID=1538716 RepID=A0AAV5VZD3_9BILA|nr:hypothetical protein PFISCL1PPCAC_14727 [Pristionchus fissidentatus]